MIVLEAIKELIDTKVDDYLISVKSSPTESRKSILLWMPE